MPSLTIYQEDSLSDFQLLHQPSKAPSQNRIQSVWLLQRKLRFLHAKRASRTRNRSSASMTAWALFQKTTGLVLKHASRYPNLCLRGHHGVWSNQCTYVHQAPLFNKCLQYTTTPVCESCASRRVLQWLPRFRSKLSITT